MIISRFFAECGDINLPLNEIVLILILGGRQSVTVIIGSVTLGVAVGTVRSCFALLERIPVFINGNAVYARAVGIEIMISEALVKNINEDIIREV